MVAHICPEVKSRYSRPSLSVTTVPFAEVKRFGKTSPPYLTKNSSAAAFNADVMSSPRACCIEGRTFGRDATTPRAVSWACSGQEPVASRRSWDDYGSDHSDTGTGRPA